MSDPTLVAPVTINGTVYRLKFSNLALRVAQKRLGMPVAKVIKPAENDLGMDILCELAGAALLHELPSASDKLVEQLLEDDPGAYWPLIIAVRTAFYASQVRLMTPEMKKAIEARLGEGKAPPSGNAGGTSVAGQTPSPTSGSAESMGSTQT